MKANVMTISRPDDTRHVRHSFDRREPVSSSHPRPLPAVVACDVVVPCSVPLKSYRNDYQQHLNSLRAHADVGWTKLRTSRSGGGTDTPHCRHTVVNAPQSFEQSASPHQESKKLCRSNHTKAKQCLNATIKAKAVAIISDLTAPLFEEHASPKQQGKVKHLSFQLDTCVMNANESTNKNLATVLPPRPNIPGHAQASMDAVVEPKARLSVSELAKKWSNNGTSMQDIYEPPYIRRTRSDDVVSSIGQKQAVDCHIRSPSHSTKAKEMELSNLRSQQQTLGPVTNQLWKNSLARSTCKAPTGLKEGTRSIHSQSSHPGSQSTTTCTSNTISDESLSSQPYSTQSHDDTVKPSIYPLPLRKTQSQDYTQLKSQESDRFKGSFTPPASPNHYYSSSVVSTHPRTISPTMMRMRFGRSTALPSNLTSTHANKESKLSSRSIPINEIKSLSPKEKPIVDNITASSVHNIPRTTMSDGETSHSSPCIHDESIHIGFVSSSPREKTMEMIADDITASVNNIHPTFMSEEGERPGPNVSLSCIHDETIHIGYVSCSPKDNVKKIHGTTVSHDGETSHPRYNYYETMHTEYECSSPKEELASRSPVISSPPSIDPIGIREPFGRCTPVNIMMNLSSTDDDPIVLLPPNDMFHHAKTCGYDSTVSSPNKKSDTTEPVRITSTLGASKISLAIDSNNIAQSQEPIQNTHTSIRYEKEVLDSISDDDVHSESTLSSITNPTFVGCNTNYEAGNDGGHLENFIVHGRSIASRIKAKEVQDATLHDSPMVEDTMTSFFSEQADDSFVHRNSHPAVMPVSLQDHIYSMSVLDKIDCTESLKRLESSPKHSSPRSHVIPFPLLLKTVESSPTKSPIQRRFQNSNNDDYGMSKFAAAILAKGSKIHLSPSRRASMEGYESMQDSSVSDHTRGDAGNTPSVASFGKFTELSMSSDEKRDSSHPVTIKTKDNVGMSLATTGHDPCTEPSTRISMLDPAKKRTESLPPSKREVERVERRNDQDFGGRKPYLRRKFRSLSFINLRSYSMT